MTPDADKEENIPHKPLTCIRNAYTLYDTPEDSGEIDRVSIDNFLHVLAEIALAVASRNLKNKEEQL